jgi:uncharacterized cupredoxin-like copper-binding protein
MFRRRYALAAAGVIAAGGLAAPLASAGDAPTAHASATVSVRAKEFKFTLSPKSGKAGSVTFHLVNRGRLKHDFKIAGHKTKVLGPGKSQSITVRLKKGTYSFLCTVKGHAAAGMKGKFKVG